MGEWLLNNIGTIAVLAVLAGIVAAVVTFMVRSKKQGKSTCSCGGSCGCCPMSGKCCGGSKKPAASGKQS